ncbi:histone H2A type 2-like [Cetorhinus maximus]
MSGHGKTRGKGSAKAKIRSSRAGLQFPIGHIHRLLRKGHNAERVGAQAPVYLATILEYLEAEILEPRTTKRPASSPATCCSLSAMMRNSTSCWEGSP